MYSRFRPDNTEGYTAAQLAELNRRYSRRVNTLNGDDLQMEDAALKSLLDNIAERVQAEYDTEISTKPYQLIDTDTRRVVAVGDSEAEVLAATPYLPADCVPDAETWDAVLEVARQHVDGIPGVVEGYAVERAAAAYSIPPFSRWDTYGGGTTTSPRRSYHVPVSGGRTSVHGSPGTYMLDPCLDGRGRLLGYQTIFCDAGGELNAAGLQRGLYAHVTSGPVPFPAARKALREHFAKNFACECDDGHKLNRTVCRYCWDRLALEAMDDDQRLAAVNAHWGGAR